MYELVFEKRALRFLNKLNEQIKKRIWDKLQECKLEPFHHLKHLVPIRFFSCQMLSPLPR